MKKYIKPSIATFEAETQNIMAGSITDVQNGDYNSTIPLKSNVFEEIEDDEDSL